LVISFLISISSISLFVRLLFCGSPKPARVVELLLVLSLLVVSFFRHTEGVSDGARLALSIVLPGFVWVIHRMLGPKMAIRKQKIVIGKLSKPNINIMSLNMISVIII